jgi:hypothetical protein
MASIDSKQQRFETIARRRSVEKSLEYNKLKKLNPNGDL